MTSIERVWKAVNFDSPDHLPIAKGKDADIAFVGYKTAAGFIPEKPGMNEWRCIWTSLNAIDGDQGQVTEHPLNDWEAIDGFSFPDAFAPGRMEGVKEEVANLHRHGKFACANLGKGPMHLLDDLRGFEAYLMDLIAEPERIELLLDNIFRFLNGLLEQFGELEIDAVFMADDQAIQSGPLFSMDLWREHFKPRYSALFAAAHERDCKVYMHSCGNLTQHLVELADAGVDILDNKQPALWMQSPAVDAVRGKITFSTCLDIQSVMKTIDIDVIEKEVSLLVHRLSLSNGGFIGTYYHQPDLDIPLEKNARMMEAFRSFSW